MHFGLSSGTHNEVIIREPTLVFQAQGLARTEASKEGSVQARIPWGLVGLGVFLPSLHILFSYPLTGRWTMGTEKQLPRFSRFEGENNWEARGGSDYEEL